uniref:Glycosyltransferase family 92 protein n=1 Tax=viral metagenome TaxID=1070528 RepID=A0A6C0JG67_9ZZZZ
MYIKSVIFTLAKYETQYIEEFVIYHIGIGISHIYIYDNEDMPTYKNILNKYVQEEKVTVIHYPGNNYQKGVQQVIMDDFTSKYMNEKNNTHAVGIDIDEFIVLKKHKNINDFIKEFINGDVAGITMNWRFFGSSNNKENDFRPVTERFINREKGYSAHVKTIFDISKFSHFRCVHIIEPKKKYLIKDTNGNTIVHIAQNVNMINNEDHYIQLNHYSSKTFDEFMYQRKRGVCDKTTNQQKFDVAKLELLFKHRDRNEIEDLLAHNIYKSITNII